MLSLELFKGFENSMIEKLPYDERIKGNVYYAWPSHENSTENKQFLEMLEKITEKNARVIIVTGGYILENQTQFPCLTVPYGRRFHMTDPELREYLQKALDIN